VSLFCLTHSGGAHLQGGLHLASAVIPRERERNPQHPSSRRKPNGIKLNAEPGTAIALAPKARPLIAQGGAERNPGPYAMRVHWKMASQWRLRRGSQGSAPLHPGLSTAGPVGAGSPATKGAHSVAGIANLMPLGESRDPYSCWDKTYVMPRWCPAAVWIPAFAGMTALWGADKTWAQSTALARVVRAGLGVVRAERHRLTFGRHPARVRA
jgi:hypothetical protein